MRRLLAAAALALLAAPAAAQAAPERSVDERLDDRRYVTVGPRAYLTATQDGRFPAMGFHTRGEMGGIWSPPIKLLDGLWFGVDGRWIGPAQRFTSGYGHVKLDLPTTSGIRVERTDFVPGRQRGVLIGLKLTNPGATRSVDVQVDAHSELMSIYPWGETKPLTQKTFNLDDRVRARRGALEFTERGRPRGANVERHDWAAVVGSSARLRSSRTGRGFRGPVGDPVICPFSGKGEPDAPARCDDTRYGEGRGGRLVYRVRLPQDSPRTLWIGVAGSESGVGEARETLEAMLTAPEESLASKIAERERLAAFTRLELPGDPLLAEAIDWTKQNLADSVQEVRDLEIRETNAGTRYPRPEGRLARARFLGAGFPDYPWLFATDGEYTAFASVAVGQFGDIRDHLRGLRRASLIDNGRSGKVVHEVITDGSVYFGSNRDPGNTDETAKFPSAVALLWRWTGSKRILDEFYAFSRSNMRYIDRELIRGSSPWPRGLGNVEREGMGEFKLDNAVYTIRGFRDLADLARGRRDWPTVRWAERRASALERRFESDWWMPRVPQYADSLDGRSLRQRQQRHWIGVTPMEVELVVKGEPVPGLAVAERAGPALEVRERRCYGDALGMFHTGSRGCDGGPRAGKSERQSFSLNTSIIAVGEGNYGRLGEGRQQRWTDANRRLQLDPEEQPGAMPEIASSPFYGQALDKRLNERAMVLQAWGGYGTAWPVVHQQLGIRPDLGRRRLEVTPQVPPGQPAVAGRNVRLGRGAADVVAERSGSVHRTSVRVGVALQRLTLGHTLPAGARVVSVRLDGAPVPYRVRDTHRGREVIAGAPPSGSHVLEVVSG